jgi:hypothetical protein
VAVLTAVLLLLARWQAVGALAVVALARLVVLVVGEAAATLLVRAVLAAAAVLAVTLAVLEEMAAAAELPEPRPLVPEALVLLHCIGLRGTKNETRMD